jgi:hypothetical protein
MYLIAMNIQPNKVTARAKVNLKPWERRRLLEIGCRCSVGEGREVQLPPGQSIASRPVVNPRANSVMGVRSRV